MDKNAAVMFAQMSPRGTWFWFLPVKVVMTDMEGTQTMFQIQQREDVNLL